ncbi:DUF5829 family protein [Collimonas humicola]|uniref:DUF5829 family protein n=1 Tax=Collimonas humicola TaxID=2825886 RepID=UPI001B8AC26A|nr:DUF5829 family protein [Collimonas humicola]
MSKAMILPPGETWPAIVADSLLMTYSQVHLNHVIVHVDGPTRSAIAQSAFLKNEFAAFEAATVAIEEGGGWSGLYIDGEQTYFAGKNSNSTWCKATPRFAA